MMSPGERNCRTYNKFEYVRELGPTGVECYRTGNCTPRKVCFVVILCRLRRNSLPPDPADPGELPYGTISLGLTFCHIKWPNVQIVTYSLPKNLTRFFVRTCGRFACFSGSHGRFYMAKRQGYVASGSQGAFPAILPLHNRPYEDEKEQKICPPALDGYHHAAIGKVFWRDGKVIWRSTLTPAEMRGFLSVDRSLADTCLGMLRY